MSEPSASASGRNQSGPRILEKFLKTAAAQGADDFLRAHELDINKLKLAEKLLLVAAKCGSTKAMRYLVPTWDLDVTYTPHPNRKSPLHLAAICGNAEAANFLLESAISLDETNCFKRQEDHGGDKRFLLTLDGYGGTVLHAAAFYGNVAFAKVMFDKLRGRDVKLDFACKKLGQTAFILAARNNQPAMLEFLKGKGADMTKALKSGHTALHMAALFGHKEATECLIRIAPVLLDVKLPEKANSRTSGFTALQLAAFYCHNKVVELLKQAHRSAGIFSEEALEVATQWRFFAAYEDFRQNSSKIARDFSIFNPRYGTVGGPDGVLPWPSNQDIALPVSNAASSVDGDEPDCSPDGETELHGIMKMSIVALSATFEQFCIDLQREAFSRAMEQDKLKYEWIEEMLQIHFENDKNDDAPPKGICFQWVDFVGGSRGAVKGEKEKNKLQSKFHPVLAARELLFSDSRGSCVNDYLKFRVDTFFKQFHIDLQVESSIYLEALDKESIKQVLQESFRSQSPPTIPTAGGGEFARAIRLQWEDFHWEKEEEKQKTKLAIDNSIRPLLAARELLFYNVRGDDVNAYLTNRLETTPHDVQPTLSGFSDSCRKLFKWKNQASRRNEEQSGDFLRTFIDKLDVTSSFQFEMPINYTASGNGRPIWPKMKMGSPASKVLEKLSRLFYGMRCVLAHGSAKRTIKETLDGWTFEKSDFLQPTDTDDSNNAKVVASYFETLRGNIIKYRRRCPVSYPEFVVCLRFYRLAARILQTTILQALGIWETGKNEPEEFDDDDDDDDMMGELFSS